MFAIYPIVGILFWLAGTNAHIAAWHKGMYCINGTRPGHDNQNTDDATTPLYNLPFQRWWFHRVNGCSNFPPAPGDILQLPAGKTFQVELATNRAFTTLSYGGNKTSQWPDGGSHPEDYGDPMHCITTPNMHTQNQSMAAGTAFAISYTSDITKVTQENLVVFSVAYHTPWYRNVNYAVPSKMPSCPPKGCTCIWTWIPNGCGEPNMYMEAFKCNVTGSTSNNPVAPAKPAVWCETDPSKCTKGAKQMIAWNQLSGNNIEVKGFDLSGHPKSPGYNPKCGFNDGPQNDIFVVPPSSNSHKSEKRRRIHDDDDNNAKTFSSRHRFNFRWRRSLT